MLAVREGVSVKQYSRNWMKGKLHLLNFNPFMERLDYKLNAEWTEEFFSVFRMWKTVIHVIPHEAYPTIASSLRNEGF